MSKSFSQTFLNDLNIILVFFFVQPFSNTVTKCFSNKEQRDVKMYKMNTKVLTKSRTLRSVEFQYVDVAAENYLLCYCMENEKGHLSRSNR